MSELLIPVALDEVDRIVHANEGSRGRSFRCPGCRGQVTWKHGNIVRSHFAHRPDEGCGESAIHAAAKLLVAQTINDWLDGKSRSPVVVPSCNLCNLDCHPQALKLGSERAIVEHTLDSGLRPDVLVGRLAIEVCHKHPIGADKIDSFAGDGIGWIELVAESLLEDPPVWRLKRSSSGRAFQVCLKCAAECNRRDAQEAARLREQTVSLTKKLEELRLGMSRAKAEAARVPESKAELEELERRTAAVRSELASATQASRALSDSSRLEELRKARADADAASAASRSLRKDAEAAVVRALNLHSGSVIRPGDRVKGWGGEGVVTFAEGGWVHWTASDGSDWASRAHYLTVVHRSVVAIEQIPA